MSNERDLIELARCNHLLLTEAQRRAAGWSEERWERAQAAGIWLQVTPGHYRHLATPLTFDMKVRAGAAWLGRRGAMFGTTALFWLGVDVPEPDVAEFVVPRGMRSVANWVRLHTTTSWNEADVTRHFGLRTTNATRAIIDFAATKPTAHELEHAIDSAVQLRRTAFARLTKRLAELRGPGHCGGPLLAELLLDTGGDSYLERRFLALLRAHQLPRPECQVVLRANGQRIGRVDFTFPAQSVVVEVSGSLGHTTARDRTKDARRRNALQQSGIQVLEFTTAHVIDDPNYVLTTLARARVTRPPTHTQVKPRHVRL